MGLYNGIRRGCAASTCINSFGACCALQYFQTAEDLGLYGRDPTVTTSKDVYVATGKPLLCQSETQHKEVAVMLGSVAKGAL